jgi:head-tail adaptor
MTDKAAKLKNRVTLAKREMINPDEPNDFGNVVGAWVDQGDVWAGYIYLRGGEAVMAGRLQGRQPVVIRLRTSPLARQVETDWQVTDVHTGTVFAVRSVNPDPESDGAWVDLLAEAGVAA